VVIRASGVLLRVAALLPLAGCAYTVQVSSTPPGATMTMPDGAIEVTPTEVRAKVAPWGHTWVDVAAPGYRTLTVDLSTSEATTRRAIGDLLFHPAAVLGYEPRGDVIFVLVPEHGPTPVAADEEDGRGQPKRERPSDEP
jgi:hypothetical protein